MQACRPLINLIKKNDFLQFTVGSKKTYNGIYIILCICKIKSYTQKNPFLISYIQYSKKSQLAFAKK